MFTDPSGVILMTRRCSTRAAFSNGNMKICGTDMPVFLYDNYRYNPEDPEEGLFQGPFLVCVSPYLLH
jgi:hypothetical protein